MSKYVFTQGTFFEAPLDKLVPGRPRKFRLFIYFKLNNHLMLLFGPEADLQEATLKKYAGRGLLSLWCPEEERGAWEDYLKQTDNVLDISRERKDSGEQTLDISREFNDLGEEFIAIEKNHPSDDVTLDILEKNASNEEVELSLAKKEAKTAEDELLQIEKKRKELDEIVLEVDQVAGEHPDEEVIAKQKKARDVREKVIAIEKKAREKQEAAAQKVQEKEKKAKDSAAKLETAKAARELKEAINKEEETQKKIQAQVRAESNASDREAVKAAVASELAKNPEITKARDAVQKARERLAQALPSEKSETRKDIANGDLPQATDAKVESKKDDRNETAKAAIETRKVEKEHKPTTEIGESEEVIKADKERSDEKVKVSALSAADEEDEVSVSGDLEEQEQPEKRFGAEPSHAESKEVVKAIKDKEVSKEEKRNVIEKASRDLMAKLIKAGDSEQEDRQSRVVKDKKSEANSSDDDEVFTVKENKTVEEKSKEVKKILADVVETVEEIILAANDGVAVAEVSRELRESSGLEAPHSGVVSALSVLFAMGLGHSDMEWLAELSLGAALHDLGLAKQGLDYEKTQSYSLHPSLGIELALQSGLQLSEAAKDTILNHHERFNGTGFPGHKAGLELSEMAQIVAIADRFDDILNGRDDGVPKSPADAFKRLEFDQYSGLDQRAVPFHPEIFEGIAQVIRPYLDNKSEAA